MNYRLTIKRRVIQFASLVLILALLSGCASSQSSLPASVVTTPVMNPPLEVPAALPDFPVMTDRGKDIPEDYLLAAENGNLRLYFQPKSSAVLVEDKRNGKLWRSSPADLATNKGTTNLWKRQIETPVVMQYVDAERVQPKIAKPERAEITISPVQDGYKVIYNYPEAAISFSTYYTIHEDYFQVTVPDGEIVESGENSLISIEAVGFLGATHDDENGYIVFPDGSGALMHFNTPHPDAVQKISNPIYGVEEVTTVTDTFREITAMPLFGMVSGDSAFAGIVTYGDFDSSLSVARSGKGTNYNHIWAEFGYRRQGRFSLTGGQPAWLYQPDRSHSDHQVRYYILTQQEANYVGIAARYRQYLINERGAKRISANEAPLIDLGFFMGTEKLTWFLRDFVTMTTFEQVGQILDDLAAAGLTRADVTLYSWNYGQVGNRYPQRLPVEKGFGGEDGLRALADKVHNGGKNLYLQDNYFLIAPGSAVVFPYLDAMRGVDGLPVGSAETGYFLNPQVALRRFAARDIPKMTQFGVDGLAIDNFATLTLPDKNQVYPLSREGFAASYMQIATLARESMGKVAMAGSNTYALPYTNRLDMVTMDSTHYDLFDDQIPLYHLVVHGLVSYTGQPFNLISDGQRMFLRSIEYGAIPFFAVSENSSAQLFRTNANGIWSSQYSFWRDEIIRQYKAYESLSGIQDQYMVNHEKLADGIFQTTYENGTRVIVNYNSQPFTDGQLSVPARDFVVLSGE
jgi:hypothetical protein